MRSVKVLRNVVTNYLRFLLAGVIGFALTPFMVHAMGDSHYGLWITVFSLTGYFGLFDQGIRPSLVRYVSRDHAAGDQDGLARTINSALALYTAVGALTLVAAFVVAANFARWFHIDATLAPIAPTLVLLVGASIALGFPLGVFGAVLSGLQRYDLANGVGMAIGILRAFAFVAVLRLGGGLVELAWVSLAMNLLGHAISWLVVRRLLPGLPLHPRWITREHLRTIGSYSSYAFVGALATNIAFQTDSLVITGLLGAAFVTPFALASGLVDNARSLVHSATWVLSPTASEMDTLRETDKLHAMLVLGTKYSVLVSWPALLALVIFGSNLMVTWVGERYLSAGLLLTILAVPTLIALPQSTAASVLFGVSRHRGVVALSLLAALLNLGLSLWWARWPAPMAALFGTAVNPGLVGVAMGTAVPLLFVSGIATAWYACRALDMPFGRYLLSGMLQPGIVCLAFVVPAVIVQRLWHPIGWWPLALAVTGCWLVFAGFAWRFGVTSAERTRWGRMIPGLFGIRPAAAEAGP